MSHSFTNHQFSKVDISDIFSLKPYDKLDLVMLDILARYGKNAILRGMNYAPPPQAGNVTTRSKNIKVGYKVHAPMSPSKRAKQFMPFDALKGLKRPWKPSTRMRPLPWKWQTAFLPGIMNRTPSTSGLIWQFFTARASPRSGINKTGHGEVCGTAYVG